MALGVVIAAWTLVGLIVAWLIGLVVQSVRARGRPTWRQLPGLPGLPIVEYQCWLPIEDFDPSELSHALVVAIDCLSVCYDRGIICSVLNGAGILVYEGVTYPGDECSEAITPVGSGPYRRIAVERSLKGLAHAVAHAIDRHSNRIDIVHRDWERRGVYAACAAYVARRSRAFAW